MDSLCCCLRAIPTGHTAQIEAGEWERERAEARSSATAECRGGRRDRRKGWGLNTGPGAVDWRAVRSACLKYAATYAVGVRLSLASLVEHAEIQSTRKNFYQAAEQTD